MDSRNQSYSNLYISFRTLVYAFPPLMIIIWDPRSHQKLVTFAREQPAKANVCPLISFRREGSQW